MWSRKQHNHRQNIDKLELPSDESGKPFNPIGGRMPVLEGPGTRAKRVLKMEYMQEMERTDDMSPDVKTSREIVSANPFETNYTLDDVFQAMSHENDRELVAVTEERRSRPSHLVSNNQARRRRIMKHGTDYPMWNE